MPVLAKSNVTEDRFREAFARGRTSPFAAVGKPVVSATSAKEALHETGCDWTVQKVPMRNALTNEVVPNMFQVIREDNRQVLGVVERRYHLVQNHEFFEVAEPFIQNGAQISRVSYLHPQQSEVSGTVYMNLTWSYRDALSIVGDIVGLNVMIRASHDGKTAALIKLMLMRLACLNGLTLPVPGIPFEWRISHTVSADLRLKEAMKVLEKAPDYFRFAGKACELLAREKVTEAEAEHLVVQAIDPVNVKRPTKIKDGARARIDAIMSRFQGDQPGADSKAMKGTAYGLWNAAVELADYGDDKVMRVKLTPGWNAQQQRFKSAFSGNGQRLKLDMYDVLAKAYDINDRLKKFTTN